MNIDLYINLEDNHHINQNFFARLSTSSSLRVVFLLGHFGPFDNIESD